MPCTGRTPCDPAPTPCSTGDLPRLVDGCGDGAWGPGWRPPVPHPGPRRHVLRRWVPRGGHLHAVRAGHGLASRAGGTRRRPAALDQLGQLWRNLMAGRSAGEERAVLRLHLDPASPLKPRKTFTQPQCLSHADTQTREHVAKPSPFDASLPSLGHLVHILFRRPLCIRPLPSSHTQ